MNPVSFVAGLGVIDKATKRGATSRTIGTSEPASCTGTPHAELDAHLLSQIAANLFTD